MERLDNGSITSVPGFQAAGVHCGLKLIDDNDLALIYCQVSCRAAAVFTSNRVKAASVFYDQELLVHNREAPQAVVINSGCANACTGERGKRDARRTAMLVAQELSLQPAKDELEYPPVLVMSTGVIGQYLPMTKIAAGIKVAAARLSSEGGHEAALAIMTTDTHPKEIAVCTTLGGVDVTIAGMCKGAGMIHPDMATMLSLIVTDAVITPDLLQEALSHAVDKSFNMTTVDGETSTNDTVLLLANGLAGNEEISEAGSLSYEAFSASLTYVATELAKMIARDGEGATKFIEISVRGAPSFAQAKQVAMAIACSPLVKTAIYGEDANWGRVLAAVGYSGVEIDPDNVAIWFGDLQLVKGGAPFDVDEERAAEILSERDVTVVIDLGLGDEEATVWTCDLSHDYVSINAHYRT